MKNKLFNNIVKTIIAIVLGLGTFTLYNIVEKSVGFFITILGAVCIIVSMTVYDMIVTDREENSQYFRKS